MTRTPMLTAARALIVAAALIAAADTALADTIRLHAAAAVKAGDITLGDVAQLEGEHAAALANIVIAQTDEKTKPNLTIREIKAALDTHGVNWSTLSLTGHTTCNLRITASETPAARPATTPHNDHRASTSAKATTTAPHTTSPITANPDTAIDVDHAVNLQQQLAQLIARANRVSVDRMEIEFSRGDEALLALPITDMRFEIEPMSVNTLGRVIYRIRGWQNAELSIDQRVSARVSQQMHVVVAKRTIRRGERIETDDVAMREIRIDDPRLDALTVLADAVGQSAAHTIRHGSVLETHQVASPTLIKRGEQVIVHALVGGLALRLEGQALEAGAMHDTITLERDGEQFTARVIGRRRASRVIHTTTVHDAPSR